MAASVDEEPKQNKKMLFYDLEMYLDKNILCILTNETQIEGRLVYFDEIANCIIETGKKKTFVFGKSIAMICQQ